MENPLQTLHKSLLDNNYDVPEDYNSFERTLTAKGDEGYQNRFQLWKSLRDNDYDVPDNYDDFRDTLFTAKQPEPATYKPTAREMAGFQQTIGQANQAGKGATAAYDRRASNLQKRQGLRVPQRVTMGESNNLVEGEQHLNPETGELEQSYITSTGNEYQNKTIADQEQRQIDQAMRDERYRKSLPGQLDDAYAERDRLNAELAQHQGQWVDQDGRVHYGNRGDDESVAALEAALRQNQQRITALEAERDDDGGTQFWRGFVDAAMNPSVQTFGLTDFNDMVQLMRVKQKIDQAHDAGQEPELSSAEQKLIESTFLNNDAQQKYGENRGFMYRAGGISMQALPFVAEFMTTGGFSALSEAGAKYGAKAAEKLALDGLSKMFVKNLGVLAGDVAAGWAMANTTGAFRTASDIMQRNMGEVTINPEGQYDFGSYDEEGNFTRGGKSLGRSIYEAEVANTLEYYTEKLGEHLQLGKWIAKGAEKMGLSKLSKAVNYLSSSKWLESGGIQDYPSEVVEEQANLVLNALLVGDNDFSTGEKGVFNAKTQADIWGGMLFSIGLMQAPRLAYTGKSAINYYQAKKTVDMADTNASIVFGEDNWARVKQQIDDCDNEQMGDMIASIATGDMNSTEKTAALNYAGDLLKMRGYNMGMMADAKDEQSSMSEEAIVSQSIDQSYGQGYNAQEPDDMKTIVNEAQASGEILSSFGEEFSKMVMDGQEEPVQTMNYLMQNRDLYTDEQIAAAADYFQKQAAANGVMDAALDNVDRQVEQANAQIRGNAHQESGNLVMAKMGDLDYYVVGGEITADGRLVGTGGAVLLKDPVTGEISVQSPANVMIYEMTPVDQLIQQNETVMRQQLMQQADDDINFGSPANEVFDMEDTVSLMDGEGGVIEGQVVQLPNAVDGVFVIQTNDGRALQMTADDMNRRIVAHNGAEVERTVAQPAAEATGEQPSAQAEVQPQPTGQQTQQPGEVAAQPQQTINEGGNADGSNVPNQGQNVPQSALSRIPVKTDASGQPVKGKNGRPVLEWHKASVEDAASALIETTGGDMLTARDTATDLVNVARGKLEKIRKQKPKGEDPIEIAESRQAIKQQEQEQQAIIKQWQDVNQDIQRRMQAEAAERQAAIEAAKSEEQRQREAEEARKLKEQQEEQDRKRLREQIEKDKERRNKEYEPLVQARKEMADDAEALAILGDTEPRTLEEFVSSLLRPHSMLWQDASDSERGLQSELGLKRDDMQRMIALLGTKESGAKPFGQVVLDIHEGLPQGMKEMYTDEDVRNTLLDLFNEGSSTRMLHLTEEHRIEEARQMKEENQRREEEAEMEAWAEAYHLTPEEREAFEAYMQEPPTLIEQEVINQIIADNEQNRTSPAVGEEPVSRGLPAGIEGSQSQVQTTAEAAGSGNIEDGLAQGEEAASNQPSVSGDDVSGTVRDRESLAILFDQIGASPVLAERMSDYDVEQLTALVEDWEIANDEYGQTIEENKDALKSKSKETREAAQKAIDDAQEQANAVFVPIEEYVEGLNVKYGIESEKPFEGAIPTPKIDKPRYDANRKALVEAYRSGDPATITAAAQAVQQYVDEGLDAGEDHTEIFDIAEDYNGNDPEKLADQYIIRTFWDRYLDDDVDPEYIKTGLKPDMRQIAPSEQLKPTEPQPIGKTSTTEEIAAQEAHVDTTPTDAQKEAGNYQKGHIKIDGLDITIENPKGSVRRGTDASGKSWETEMHNTYGYIRGTKGADKDHIDVFLSDDPTHPDKVFIVQQRKKVNGVWKFDELKVLLGFENASQASNAYLSNYEEGWNGMDALIETDMESFKDWLKNGKQKGTYKEDGAWAKVYPGVSTMVADEGEMPEPEQQEVQVLRGTGDNRLSGMDRELPEVSGGYGQASISQGDSGQNRREQGLLQGELQVDRLDNPVSEPEDGTLSDVQGQNDVNATVGSGNGTSAGENKIQNTDVPLERGENAGNSGRDQGQLQDDNISGQDNENGRLGEGTQSKLQDVKEPAKNGLDNGKNSNNADEHKASGRVNAASRRETVLRDALVEHLQGSGVTVVTDAEEGQRVLDEFNGRLTDDVKRMGSRVDSKKKQLSDEIGQRELSEAQQTVVDVFTGRSDNQPITVSREGKDLTVKMRQGNERGAGTKHSLFRHYGTGTGVVTADDVMRIPDVLANGERTEKGKGNVKLAVYKLTDESGKKYTVVTEIKKSGEVFNDFYTNKKASNQTPQMPNGDTPEGARTNDLNASSDAKVQQNSETAKDSERKFFKTPDGQAYGYTYQGKIYIDPRIATSETPIHEYGHLWAEMKRQTAPEEWGNIKQVMLGDKLVQPIIEKVKRDYPELAKEGKEDDFIEEIITQFSGKRGAERLREIANEVAAERGGVFGKAEAMTAMQRLKNILNSFWEGVAKMMGWKYRNANQIADRMMADMLNGVNPRQRMKDGADRLSEMRAYHGSAAEFDRFDHTKVGSGEGQAVSGYGTYVTTSEGTARYYANVASTRQRKVIQPMGYTFDGEVVKDPALARAYDYLKKAEGNVGEAIKACEHTIEVLNRHKDKNPFGRLGNGKSTAEEAMDYLLKEKEKPGTIGFQEEIVEQPDRQLYEVEIPDDTGKNYFDLDKKLTKKQKADIKKRFLEALDSSDEADYWKKNRDIIEYDWKQVDSSDGTGDAARGVMEQFLPSEKVSEIFSDMGYVGSKVKGSDGTTYIIYNADSLQIKDRMKFQKVSDQERPHYQPGENAMDYAERLEEYRREQSMGEPEEVPVNIARQIYEDAVRDTGEQMMIPALLRSIGNKEQWTRFKHKFAESYFDYSRSIKALQDAIEKATGKAVEGFEDVWRTLNAKSSIDSVELQNVMNDYIMPLSSFAGSMVKDKKIDGRRMTVDDVEKYMNAVHGIERNVAMAMKEARNEYEEDTALQRQQLENGELDARERKSLEAALLIKEARFKGIKDYMDNEDVSKWWNQWVNSVERGRAKGTLSEEEYEKTRKKMDEEYNRGWQYKYRDKDYSGLTELFGEDFKEDAQKPSEEQLEQAARDFAAKFEDIVGKEQADKLWELVKALNDWSLRKSYESGLISKDQYNDTMSMYEHYVPLRGWHDDYAGDVYQYISRGEPAEVLQGVLKKAYGRKSRAARLFGTMAAMANTAIVQGNRNNVAQRLLNMAMNHQDSGLLMVSEQYYQKTADDNLVPLTPNLRDDMTAEEMVDELERFEEDMKAREEAGEVQPLRKKFKKEFPLHMAKWQEQRHAVRVLRGGKEYMVYVLGNPRAAEAFNGLLNPHSEPGAVSDVISRYMRFLAKMQTSLSPEFLVSNFQRDVLTASTGAYMKFGKDYQKRFVKNLASVMPLTAIASIRKGKNLGGIFSLFSKYDSGTLDMSNDMERMFKEFIDGGGMTGISYITKSEEYQASMEKIVKRMREGKMGKVKNAAEAISEAVEFANKGIENATRFATYMTSRQQGRSIRESVFDAKEGSVNFNMKGSGAWGNMQARKMYLYVNPAMQALRMLDTWYENDPMVTVKKGGEMVTKAVGRRFMKAAALTLTASVSLGILNIMLSELLHGDDDDDKKEGDWWALSEWNRYNFVNFINPFGKGYFHWSLPQEIRPVWALGQIAIDMAYGRVTWQRGMQSMLLQLNNLSPLSFFEGGTDTNESIISSELRTMTPSYISPFTDAYLWNRDFMGHPITNQNSWNKEAPEWQRAGKNTPKMLIEASRQWNELTGGRRNKKSWADSPYLNPSAVYYLLTQQFGGMGSMTKRMMNAFDQWQDPEQDVESRNLPFVPKFYVTTGDDYSKDRVMNDKFWMYWNEFRDAEYEINKDNHDEEMDDAERQKTIEERKADGTYQHWETINDNALDYVYNKVRGTGKEKAVKKMVLDAIESGVKPDYTEEVENAETPELKKMWETAARRQKLATVEDIPQEELARDFDDTEDGQLRQMMASRISKEAGASKDPYGGNSDSKMGNRYQELRTAEDVREDALLFSYQEKAKSDGNKELADEISKARGKVRSGAKNNFHLGEKYGLDEHAMRYIRRWRKKLLEKYGPSEASDNDDKQ